jgi:L-lysine exporter family protein LysE/ArgO
MVSARYQADRRICFAIGAATGSLAWFASLGFGARILAPVFSRQAAWRILDGIIAIIMFILAAGLAREGVHSLSTGV